MHCANQCSLIPLLLDDPLWVYVNLKSLPEGNCLNSSFTGWPTLGTSEERDSSAFLGLNPSFTGWPTLGVLISSLALLLSCLNPSFTGWPTLGAHSFYYGFETKNVLIPLLLDDPLWAKKILFYGRLLLRLNPSFAGWPTLGRVRKWLQRPFLVLIPLLLDDPLWASTWI